MSAHFSCFIITILSLLGGLGLAVSLVALRFMASDFIEVLALRQNARRDAKRIL